MAEIYFLGTLSGTEPFEGMHHCSLVIEAGGMNYWFDAGEGCAYTAHTMGLDVLNTRALFVSHPHPDHTCGLPHLLLVLVKLIRRLKRQLIFKNRLDVFFPGLKTFEGAKILFKTFELKDQWRFEMVEHEMQDGLLFEDENIRVSALHNRHMKEDGSKGWHSYSFLIEVAGKRVVFSGDVLSSDELDPLVKDGCDLLIHETGHHPVSDVCEYAIDRKVGTLFFNHHGREIINGREEAEKLVAEYAKKSGIPMKILSDRDRYQL